MIYTLFFSRLRPEYLAEQATVYNEDARNVLTIAQEYPGFIDMKRYTADDGERLTVVRFKDAEAQSAWRRDPRHVTAQQRGRAHYYEEYRIVICQDIRTHAWQRDDQPKAG